MITFLKEYIEVDSVQSEIDALTDFELDSIESYSIEWDQDRETNILVLFNSEGGAVRIIEVDEPEVIVGILEELFELEEDDLEWLESYGWVEDGSIGLGESLATKKRIDKALRDELLVKGLAVDDSELIDKYEVDDVDDGVEKQKIWKNHVDLDGGND